jgi:hypothetical protein
MSSSSSKSVYLVCQDTEFYSSETKVLGVYLSLEEALQRVARLRGIGEMQEGRFGSFWKNKEAGLRFYLRAFRLGEQPDTTHRGNTVTLEAE